MALVQKSFSDIITFSRSSNATRVGPTGLVEYAPHNLILQSQTFDNASWATGNATVTANAAPAPDGTVTAELLIENSSNAEHRVFQSVTTVASTYTVSCYIKANTRNWAYIRIRDSSSADRLAFFNLATGVIGTVQTGLTASIQSVGNNWYRCVVTISSAFAGSNPIVLGVSSADNTEVYTGNGTGSIYLWGAQLSVGPYALDYTPTTSAAVYGPRFDYDPVTLAARGLLVEEQRTNLLTYSEQFDSSDWVKSNSSVTANSTTSPNGTNTADKLVEDTSTNGHLVYQSFTSTAQAYTWSCYVKAAERTQCFLRAQDASLLYAYFDLSAGTVISSEAGLTASIQNVGNGWYRCIVTRTVSAGTSYFVVGTAVGGNASYTGNGTSGIYIWGAQLEAGSFATSYIPTLASTVTRSADVASVNTLSPFYNAVEGTLFAELSGLLSTSYFQAPAYNFGDSNNRIELRAIGNPFTYNRSVVTTAGVTQVDISSTGLPSSASTPRKVALAYKLDDFATVGTGGTVATDTSGTIPTVSVLNIGTAPYDSSIKTNGWIARIAYYPRRLTNAEIQALTS